MIVTGGCNEPEHKAPSITTCTLGRVRIRCGKVHEVSRDEKDLSPPRVSIMTAGDKKSLFICETS